ncbi:hypothetical protein TCE0_017f03621 [Talaromyces pinophilus]|uniref:BTB domain-containing protein n=1 Tax=Talaromyces pinophilus TaxID=128442 RepID=A0A6V8H2Y3_TALPI|nr:hypothetical protein TCE0_017f03621 [Talaromyces pinophilus]
MSNKEKKPICASALPNPTPEAKSIPKNDDKPFDFFSGAMNEYWETGHFSDLVISVKGYNVRAHRMVVCSQSGYLNFLVRCLHVKDKKAKTIKNPDNMITTSVNAFKAMIGWVYGIDYIPPGDENKTYIHAEIVKQSTDIPDSEFDAEAFLRLVNHELYCARGGMRFLLTDICVRKIEVLLTEPKLDNVFKNHGHFFPRHSTMGLGRKRPDVRCLECGEFCDNEIVVRCLQPLALSPFEGTSPCQACLHHALRANQTRITNETQQGVLALWAVNKIVAAVVGRLSLACFVTNPSGPWLPPGERALLPSSDQTQAGAFLPRSSSLQSFQSSQCPPAVRRAQSSHFPSPFSSPLSLLRVLFSLPMT